MRTGIFFVIFFVTVFHLQESVQDNASQHTEVSLREKTTKIASEDEEEKPCNDKTNGNCSMPDGSKEIMEKELDRQLEAVLPKPQTMFPQLSMKSSTSEATYEIISESVIKSGNLQPDECDDEDDCEPSNSGSGDEDNNKYVLAFSPPKNKNNSTSELASHENATYEILSESVVKAAQSSKPNDVFSAGDSSDKTSTSSSENTIYEVISESVESLTNKFPSKECDDEDECDTVSGDGAGDNDVKTERVSTALSSGKTGKQTTPVDVFIVDDSNSKSPNENDTDENTKPIYEVISESITRKETVPEDAFTADDTGTKSSPNNVDENVKPIYEIISQSIEQIKQTLSSEDCDDEDDCQLGGSGDRDNGERRSDEKNFKGLSPPNEKEPNAIYEVISESTTKLNEIPPSTECDDEKDCQPSQGGSGSSENANQDQGDNTEPDDHYSSSMKAPSPPKNKETTYEVISESKKNLNKDEIQMKGETTKMHLFLGTSYSVSSPLGKKARDRIKGELNIKPLKMSGVLFYNGMDETKTKTGDFIALYLRNGYVELSFNCGSRPVRIRSRNTIEINKWHNIKIYRSGRLGSLTVNDGTPSFGISPGPLNTLDLHQNLSIGGVPRNLMHEVDANIGISKGFTGYIHNLKIKGHEINLKSQSTAGKTDSIGKTRSCSDSPCKNGGSCFGKHGQYFCLCSSYYRGRNCEKEINFKPLAFQNESYVQFSKSVLLKILRGREGAVTFSLKTTQSKGIIIWEAQKVNQFRERYVMVSLESGFVSLSFDLGFQRHLVYSKVPVNDGLWHQIKIERETGSDAALVIDQRSRKNFKSVADLSRPKTKIDLYIGGLPSSLTKVTKIPGFEGCLRKFQFEYLGYLQHLDFEHDAVTAHDIKQCSRP